MDAVDAEHVRDLVRVGDDRGRTEREHEARELVDHELRGLEVHVRVDEPGDDVASRASSDSRPSYVAEPGDDPVGDRDVDLEPLRVKTESTRPPRTTRSAGSSPRATARRRCSASIGGSVMRRGLRSGAVV